MKSSAKKSAALSERLNASGLRPTPQREVVFKVILEKRDHPTADEIFARVKAQLPTISLATVYNCLETLVQCHLIRQVNLERAPTRYCPNLHEHAHFHDQATGQIYDVDLPPELLTQLQDVLPDGFHANVIELTFRGSAATKRRPANLKACDCATTNPHGTN